MGIQEQFLANELIRKDTGPVGTIVLDDWESARFENGVACTFRVHDKGTRLDVIARILDLKHFMAKNGARNPSAEACVDCLQVISKDVVDAYVACHSLWYRALGPWEGLVNPFGCAVAERCLRGPDILGIRFYRKTTRK